MIEGMAISRMLQAMTVSTTLALALTACGSDDSSTPASDAGKRPAPSSEAPSNQATDAAPSTTPAATGGPLQVRRVLEATGIPAATEAASPLPTDCDGGPSGQPKPGAGAIACDDAGVVYRLAPAEVVGGVESAKAERPQGLSDWVVSLELDAATTPKFAALTHAVSGTDKLIAFVLDGEVISALTVQTPIDDGRLQIGGTFTERQAQAFAAQLDS
jgi:preprotein translocase subunit SecD